MSENAKLFPSFPWKGGSGGEGDTNFEQQPQPVLPKENFTTWVVNSIDWV